MTATIAHLVAYLYLTATAALLTATLWIARSIQKHRHHDAAHAALDHAEHRIRRMGPQPAAAHAIAAIHATRQHLDDAQQQPPLDDDQGA